MMRRLIPLTLALLATVSALAVEPGVETRKRPNVILIMTDDQGYGDLACHGNPVIKTPNLDRLHAESVRLINFHVDPACAPTRAALMTGRYSHRAGVWHVVLNPSLLPIGEKTMGDVFSAAGYRTALFGKWHLGDNCPYRPGDRGFQEVITMGGGVVGHTPDYWLNDYFDDHYRHNGRWEKFPGYCTDLWFDRAIKFARESGDQPFFIYLPVNAPHQPLQVPASYIEPYADQPEKTQRFYGMIACVDRNVGRLRAELSKSGLEHDTILVFMTDNGSINSRVFNAGMRGGKAAPYEGGHRVPCFIHWPGGGITGGRDVDRLTAHFDLLPTLAGLCDLPLPEGVQLDGLNLTPLLSTPDAAWAERTLVVEWQGAITPVKWNRSCVMTDRWRLINGRELYDMQAMPDQSRNVAAAHPAVVARLRGFYDQWWDDVSARDDIIREIPIGADAAPTVRLTAYDWITRTGQQRDMPWGQIHIVKGPLQNGYWALRVERDGDYCVRLRRWPVESGLAINDTTDVVPPERSWHPVEPAVLKTTRARITIQDVDRTVTVGASDEEATFDVKLTAGSTRLQTWFLDDDGRSRGAYYVHVEHRPSSPAHAKGEGQRVADLVTPVMTEEAPAAGKRVRQVAPEYKGTEVHHSWKGVFTHDHFDGHKEWGYPESDRASALKRLARLQGRPVLVCGQHASHVRDQFLKDHMDLARFTFLDVPTTKIFTIPEGNVIHPHTDLWMHRESPYRRKARAWLQRVLKE